MIKLIKKLFSQLFSKKNKENIVTEKEIINNMESQLKDDEIFKIIYTIHEDEINVETDLQFLTEEEKIKTQVTLLFYMFTPGFRDLVFESLRNSASTDYNSKYIQLLIKNIEDLIEENKQSSNNDLAIYPNEVLK